MSEILLRRILWQGIVHWTDLSDKRFDTITIDDTGEIEFCRRAGFGGKAELFAKLEAGGERENARLEQELTEAKTEIASLKAQLADLHGELEPLQKEWATAWDKCAALEKRLAEMPAPPTELEPPKITGPANTGSTQAVSSTLSKVSANEAENPRQAGNAAQRSLSAENQREHPALSYDPAEEIEKNTIRGRMLEYLHFHGPQVPKELAAAIGTRSGSVSSCGHQLKAAGLLQRLEGGLWALVKQLDCLPEAEALSSAVPVPGNVGLASGEAAAASFGAVTENGNGADVKAVHSFLSQGSIDPLQLECDICGLGRDDHGAVVDAQWPKVSADGIDWPHELATNSVYARIVKELNDGPRGSERIATFLNISTEMAETHLHMLMSQDCVDLLPSERWTLTAQIPGVNAD